MNVQPFSAKTPATQATMRVSAATHPQHHLQQRNRKEEALKGKGQGVEETSAVGAETATAAATGSAPGRLAQAMPQTAAWVAELRLLLGAERVDRALAASQRARRHHAALAAAQGPARAEAWLNAQPWPHGRFWAQEGGQEVGLQVQGGRPGKAGGRA